ncbi:MAG: polysulfide reductase, partial [Armatimonadetes bacterium CG_4_8_14_3_um_filter_58_9]
MRSSTPSIDPLEATALRPIQQRSSGFYLLAFALVATALWGVNALVFHQWRNGLQVTGLNCPVFWGVYITNFVFFVGISHAGTLISAILRVTGQEWRRPITRMAEAITVFALMVGPINVIFDMGRPDRMLNIFKHPNFNSPLLWDVCCISVYFVGSITFLYLPMIPDIALLRDRMPHRRFYRILALGWKATDRQKHRLEKGNRRHV